MTTFAATHSQDTPKSTAVDTLTYNENTGELVIDWRGELWKYDGVSKATFDQVLSGTYKNSPVHASVGRSASKVKRDFGPGKHLGRFGEVKFVKDTTKATAPTFPTASAPAKSAAPQTFSLSPASNVGVEKASYTVDFKDPAGEKREYTAKGVGSVDEAVSALNEVADALGVNLTVTGVYVDFE